MGKFLVLGSAGFIGIDLVKQLKQTNENLIYVYDNLLVLKNIHSELSHSHIYAGDELDIEYLYSLKNRSKI